MQCGHPEEMLLKWAVKLLGQYRSAIFSTLSGAYRDHPSAKVDVLYPKGDALIDPQSSAVHQFGHEARRALHKVKNPLDLVCG